MSRLPTSEAGFSLIELMVSVLLGLVLVMGTASFYATLNTTSTTASQLGSAQESLQAVNLVVGRALRQASSATVQNGGKGLVVTYNNIQSGDQVLSCLGHTRANGDSDTFSVQNGALYCNDGNGTAQMVAIGLQDLTFSSAGTYLIQIVVKPQYLPASYTNGISLSFAIWQQYIQSRLT